MKRFKRVESPEVNQVKVDSSVPHILTIEIPKLKEKIRKSSQKRIERVKSRIVRRVVVLLKARLSQDS